MSKTENQRQIKLNNQPLLYRVQVSPRARNLRLKINAREGLVVVVPRDFDQSDLPNILQRKSDWILKQQRFFESIPPNPTQHFVRDGDTLLYLGDHFYLRLEISVNGHRRSTIQQSLGEIRLHLPEAEQRTPEQILEAWYRRCARQVFQERIVLINQKLRVQLGRVYVMDQKTKWGGCSRQGNLSFNWRLVMAPLEVVDYIVAHELCHLLEHNHGPRFWLLLQSICPDYLAHKQWLKEHGHALRF